MSMIRILRAGGLGALLLLVALLAPLEPLSASEPDSFRELKNRWEGSAGQSLTDRLPILEAMGACNEPAAGRFLVSLFVEGNPSDPRTNALHVTVLWILAKRGDEASYEAIVTHGFTALPSSEWRAVEQAVAAHPPKGEAEDWLFEKGYKVLPRLEERPQGIVLGMILASADPRSGEVAADLLGNRALPPGSQALLVELLRRNGRKDTAKKVNRLFRVKDADLQIAVLRALRDFEAEEYSKTFHDGLESRFWQVRATAADVFGGTLDPEVVPSLVPLLGDAFPEVQVAAVQALQKIGGRAVVDPLIAALEDAPGRVRDDIADALLWLTGQDLGPEHLAWKNWWATNAAKTTVKEITREEFERRRAEAAGSTTGTYYGLRVISRFVTFVVDVSGSMNEPYLVDEEKERKGGSRRGGTSVDPEAEEEASGGAKQVQRQKIEVARAELGRAVKGLRDGTEFNIIAFDSLTAPWQRNLVEMDSEIREQALGYVERLSPGGTTNIFDTLVEALADARVNTIYFLSDGAPTAGSVQDSEEILRRIRELNEIRKVKIHTIGFHLDPNAAELMRRLAEENHGSFVAR